MKTDQWAMENPFLQPPRVVVLTAAEQRRTPIIDRIPIRPRVPSKAAGRRGTRRAWKRAHPPRLILVYQEPADLIVYGSEPMQTIIATPAQNIQIQKMWRATGARP